MFKLRLFRQELNRVKFVSVEDEYSLFCVHTFSRHSMSKVKQEPKPSDPTPQTE